MSPKWTQNQAISKWQYQLFWASYTINQPVSNVQILPSTNLLVFNGITSKLQRLDTLRQCLLGNTLKHWFLQWTSHQHQATVNHSSKTTNLINPSRKIVYSTLKTYSTNLTLLIKQKDNTRGTWKAPLYYIYNSNLWSTSMQRYSFERQSSVLLTVGYHMACMSTAARPFFLPRLFTCPLSPPACSGWASRDVGTSLCRRVEEGWVRWRDGEMERKMS